MKSKYFFLSVLLSFVFGTGVLIAQPGGGRNSDPVARAEQQTQAMTEQLSLSEPQALKVREINLKYAQKIKTAREESEGDWEAMRSVMTAIRADQDKELQTVMTGEQWQQWVKYRDEQRANMGPKPGGAPRDTAHQKPPKTKE